jgi:hypothetical protein
MFFSKAQTQSSLPNIHSEQNFQGKSCVSIKSERNALLFVCKGGKHPLGQGAWGGWWGPLLSGEPRFRGDSVAIDKAVRALDLASRRPEGTGLDLCFPVKSVRGLLRGKGQRRGMPLNEGPSERQRGADCHDY